ncbi:MAG: glycosyltransferase [Acidobacteria bacterium]|nr:glycosyltransferase [Acidobacteriota bacterium]
MKPQIKLLHFITNSCHHPYLYAVTDYTNKDRFDISVGSLNSAGDLQKHYEEQRVKNFSLAADNRSQFPKAVLKLARWLKKNKIDVIQTHLYDASLVGLAAAKLARTPLKILTGHHSHEMQFYKGKLAFWGDCLSSRLLADYIIAPSQQMKEIFVEYEGVSPEKIAVVHHGFDFTNLKRSEAGRERIRNEFKLKDKIIFGSVGKIFWIKDYLTLLRAFAPIASKFPETVLMIAGSGDQKDLLKLGRELSIEKQIVFTSWREDVSDIFSAIDVFAHPALAESFGMVIVEAMAMEKPVICADVGIAREIIKDGANGFLVPAGNAEKFGAAMEKMIFSRSQWSAMGKTNRERVREFTAAKMAANYEKCYIKWLAAREKL